MSASTPFNGSAAGAAEAAATAAEEMKFAFMEMIRETGNG
jgi:hypothetical protein